MKTSNYWLFLDDVRVPEQVFEYTNNQIYLLGWKIIRNYDDFISCVTANGIPKTISFDHDLASEHYNISMYGSEYNKLYDGFTEKTGFDCAKWLINYCIDNDLDLPETILIHSMNPAGSTNIKSLFDTYYKYNS